MLENRRKIHGYVRARRHRAIEEEELCTTLFGSVTTRHLRQLERTTFCSETLTIGRFRKTSVAVSGRDLALGTSEE